MDLYEVESKIKELEASYNKEADNLMQELNAYKKKNPILPPKRRTRFFLFMEMTRMSTR